MSDGEQRIGESVGGYVLGELIATGGMGDVYEAVHGFTGRTVAVKRLRSYYAGRADIRERMRLEAIVLSKLRHPNVVTVYDAGVTEPGIVWMAMERLVGRTLRDVVFAGERIEIQRALTWGRQIAAAVGAAHRLGVVHRDLKPENVFVTEQGDIKVLDLGTAKFYGYGLETLDKRVVMG